MEAVTDQDALGQAVEQDPEPDGQRRAAAVLGSLADLGRGRQLGAETQRVDGLVEPPLGMGVALGVVLAKLREARMGQGTHRGVELGALLAPAVEVLRVERQRFHPPARAAGRRTRAVREQRDLAHGVARAERCHGLTAVVELHMAAAEEEHRPAALAFAEQQLAVLEDDRLQVLDVLADLVGRDVSQQVHP